MDHEPGNEDRAPIPVKEWLESTSNVSGQAPNESSDGGTASLTCDACIRVLMLLLSESSPGRNNILREVMMKLQLWRDGFSSGELEMVLSRSRSLRINVLKHLRAVAINLENCEPSYIVNFEILNSTNSPQAWKIVVPSLDAEVKERLQGRERILEEAKVLIKFDDNSSDSDSDSDAPSKFDSGEDENHEYRYFITEIQHHVGLLMNLLPSLQHILDYKLREEQNLKVKIQENQFIPTQAASAYINIIREKYPKAKTDLVERLGEANWQRHLTIRKKLEASAKEVPRAEEEISVAKPLFHPISTFQDYGLETSLSTPNIRADASVASHSSFRTSATEGSMDSLRVLEMPLAVKLGVQFKCQICGKSVRGIKDRYQWKYATPHVTSSFSVLSLTLDRLHVFADLEAYICTFQECEHSIDTFPSRELWAAHEFSVHRKTKTWACPKCSAEFPESHLWKKHVLTQHPEWWQSKHGAVSYGPELDAASKAAERYQDRECPFCFKITSGKQRDFVSHVGKHMEAIALAALPKESESDVENSDTDTCFTNLKSISGDRGELTLPHVFTRNKITTKTPGSHERGLPDMDGIGKVEASGQTAR
jgi:hypothetical protein